MDDMLWVVFSYWHLGALHVKNHKLLYPSPICDQPDIKKIEELLARIFSAHDVTLINWRRFEEP